MEKENMEKKSFDIKKHFRNLFFIILGIVIIKWIILMMPSSTHLQSNQQSQPPLTKKQTFQEVSYNLNIKDKVGPQIDTNFDKLKMDIDNYRREQLDEYKMGAYYRLDNFLDWLFDYFTGYKIVGHKLGSWLGISNKDDVDYVKHHFNKKVVKKALLKQKLNLIDKYAQNKIKDFYLQTFVIIQNNINDQIKMLKSQGVKDIKVDTTQIPYAKYVTASMIDGYFVYQGLGVAGGALGGAKIASSKVVASKAGSMAGSKVGSIVGSKIASLAASKVGAVVSFGIGIIVDIGLNEAVKQVKYDKTKKSFKKAIDKYVNQLYIEISNTQNQYLYDIKNSIITELNKQVTIKGIK